MSSRPSTPMAESAGASVGNAPPPHDDPPAVPALNLQRAQPVPKAGPVFTVKHSTGAARNDAFLPTDFGGAPKGSTGASSETKSEREQRLSALALSPGSNASIDAGMTAANPRGGQVVHSDPLGGSNYMSSPDPSGVTSNTSANTSNAAPETGGGGERQHISAFGLEAASLSSRHSLFVAAANAANTNSQHNYTNSRANFGPSPAFAVGGGSHVRRRGVVTVASPGAEDLPPRHANNNINTAPQPHAHHLNSEDQSLSTPGTNIQHHTNKNARANSHFAASGSPDGSPPCAAADGAPIIPWIGRGVAGADGPQSATDVQNEHVARNRRSISPSVDGVGWLPDGTDFATMGTAAHIGTGGDIANRNRNMALMAETPNEVAFAKAGGGANNGGIAGGGGDGGGEMVPEERLPPKKPAGVFMQLLATLRRQFHQKRRAFIITALEFLLPVVFALVLFLLNEVIDITEYPRQQFVSATDTPITLAVARQYGCYFDPFPADIKALGVRTCTAAAAGGGRIGCARPGLLPVDNYCAVNGGPLTTASLAALQHGENEFAIPNLNDLVLSKWIWRMYIPSGSDLWNDGLIMSMRNYGKVYLIPDTQGSRDVATWLSARHTMFKYIFGGYFNSRGDATAFSSQLENEGKVWAVIDIRDMTTANFEIVIMSNHSGVPDLGSGAVDPSIAGKGDIPYNMWLGAGFLTFQKMMQDYYLSSVHSVPDNELNIAGPVTALTQVPMGVNEYRKSQFLTFGQTLGPLVIVMGYMFPVAQLAKRLVEEKELRLREGTMIMGLTKMAFFGAWLLMYYAITTVCAFAVAGVLKAGVFEHTDYFLITFTFWLFGISSVNIAALIATLFNNAKIASIVVPLVYFALCIPGFALPADVTGAYHGLSIFSPIAMSVAIRLLFVYEQTTGVRWSQLDLEGEQPYGFVYTWVWMFSMAIAYFIIMLYLDAVLPKEWGVRRHPFFIVMPRSKGGIWGRRPKDSFGEDHSNDGTVRPASDLANCADLHTAIEDYPKGRATVVIEQLVKEFKNGKVKMTAVNNVDLRMFPNGITVVLGHNGAGKTTVMNMMTGMMPPTSGDVRIYGNSIRTNLEDIRRDIGFCPQHNILWADLTCLEHLEYFARLKGIKGSEITEEAMEMLDKVDLLEKAKVLSKNLSGGQKRKLSVAIAFMGRARFVMLDEPTAGMDVAARRHTWDVLKDMSRGRTILLTTHYMDEADLLGSRIAIMSKGCLHSYGTPMYLKNSLGSGYTCRIAFANAVDDPEPLLREIQALAPHSGLEEAKGQEIAVSMAKDDSRRFPDVIRFLQSDAAKKRHGIVSISMSAATLDSVFLNIANEEKHHEEIVAQQQRLRAGEGSPNEPTAGHGGSNPAHVLTEEERAEAFAELETIYTRLSQRTADELSAANGGAFPPESARAGVFSNSETGTELQLLGTASPQSAATTPQHGTLVSASSAKSSNKNKAPHALTKKVPTHKGKQLGAMMMKRLHFARRDYCALIMAIIAPVICIVIAMCIDLVSVGEQKLFWIDNNAYHRAQMAELANCPAWYQKPVYGPSYELVLNHAGSTPTAFSTYLLDTYYTHPYGRMTAMYCNDPRGNTLLLPNASSLIASPHGLLELYNAKLRRSTGNNALTMKLGSWPLPYTAREKDQVDSIKAILMALCVLVPFSFVPATFVAFIVRERASKSKHLQFVSGANFLVYWLANFLFDFVTFAITSTITIIIFFIFNRQELIGTGARIGATILLFFMFILSGTGVAYFLSHFFNNYSTAQTMVMLFNLLTGFVLVIIMFFLDTVQSTHDTSRTLVFFFRVVPSYCLGDGLINLVKNRDEGGLSLIYGDMGGPFALDVVGYDLIYMAVQALIFFSLAIITDHPSWNRRRQLWQQKRMILGGSAAPADPEYEDEDVRAEREAAEGETRPNDVVRVQRMRKEFKIGHGVKKYAVQNLSFGVKHGEVFGFLGTNGAGKTTTMSMLTTEIIPTWGKATVGGYDVVEDAEKTRKLIGYCPQFDAIIDRLTPDEHLRLFAALRGLSLDDTRIVLDALVKTCGLSEYRSVPAGRLSGGNKRKLSVAMALIGGPSIVFLDEPSAGMDPHARRQLWDVISFVAKHSSVLLTTHHLEEVDVLAHRVGIMDAGLMRCLGSLEHLKMKFGSGYELIVQRRPGRVREANRFLIDTFPEAVVVEVRQMRVSFSLPYESTDLADVFQIMQFAAEDPATGIADYIVQQTSLEQVFMRISAMKEQEIETYEHAKKSKFRGDDERIIHCDERNGEAATSPLLEAYGSPMDTFRAGGIGYGGGFGSERDLRRQASASYASGDGSVFETTLLMHERYDEALDPKSARLRRRNTAGFGSGRASVLSGSAVGSGGAMLGNAIAPDSDMPSFITAHSEMGSSVPSTPGRTPMTGRRVMSGDSSRTPGLLSPGAGSMRNYRPMTADYYAQSVFRRKDMTENIRNQNFRSPSIRGHISPIDGASVMTTPRSIRHTAIGHGATIVPGSAEISPRGPLSRDSPNAPYQ